MNSVKAIRISRDKLHTKEVLGAADVRTPREIDIESALSGSPSCGFVVKNRFGFGAQGMSAHPEGERVNTDALKNKLRNPRYFLEALIKCEREYRVFVVNGKVAHVCVKIPREGTESDVIRNAANSKFVVCRGNRVRSLDVKTQAVAAAEACGLYRAAVDVGLDSSGKAWIWETNTKPAITRDYVRRLWNGEDTPDEDGNN